MAADSANVAETRHEILRLIEKLSGARASAGSEESAPPLLSPESAGRQHDLSKIKKRRKQLEIELLEAKLLALYKKLELRIQSIEERMGEEVAKALALQSQPPKPDVKTAISTTSTLAGQIREGLLADIVQLISSSILSGTLTIEGAGTVEVYFIDGEIIDAWTEGAAAESAFFAAMAMDEGTFSFEENDEIREKKIQSKTQFLILEALRQVDESRADEEL